MKTLLVFQINFSEEQRKDDPSIPDENDHYESQDLNIDAILIDYVKGGNHHLYDKRAKNHKYFDVKQNVWEEIGR